MGCQPRCHCYARLSVIGRIEYYYVDILFYDSCSVAAGSSKGFVVANFLVKQVVLVHPTVRSDGVGSRSITRYVYNVSYSDVTLT